MVFSEHCEHFCFCIKQIEFMSQFGNRERMVKTRSSKKCRTKVKISTKSCRSIKIQNHAYTLKSHKIRKPVKRSLAAMTLIAIKNISEGTVCQILNELTCLGVNVTRNLVEKVLEYFYEKRVLKVTVERKVQRFSISKSPRTTKYLKKLFPDSKF